MGGTNPEDPAFNAVGSYGSWLLMDFCWYFLLVVIESFNFTTLKGCNVTLNVLNESITEILVLRELSAAPRQNNVVV